MVCVIYAYFNCRTLIAPLGIFSEFYEVPVGDQRLPTAKIRAVAQIDIPVEPREKVWGGGGGGGGLE